MSRKRVLALTLGAAVLTSGRDNTATAVQPVFSAESRLVASAQSPHGTIVFHSSRDGDFEVFTMNPDGSEQTQLTFDTFNQFDPQWSASGREIAVIAYGAEYPFGALRVMNADGSDARDVIQGANGEYVGNFAWSPSSRRFALAYGGRITVINADGTDATVVPNSDGAGGVCSWSRDGKRIVFVHYTPSGSDLEIINVDGSGRRVFVANAEGDHATWSPDGHQFLFSSRRDGGDLDIFVMNADGSSVRQLTHNDSDDDDPVWSPDGKWIAFQSTRDGDEEVFVMNADGSDVRQLTSNDGAYDAVPSWKAAAR
jgi:Tol biopolymer transport system component